MTDGNHEPVEDNAQTNNNESESESESSEQPMSFEELEKLADDEKLTQDKLAEELNKYAQAYREEFELKLSESEAPEDVIAYTKNYFQRNIHAAAAQIVWLATNAEKENTRLAAAKYVVDKACETAAAGNDPLTDLLNDLTKVEKGRVI